MTKLQEILLQKFFIAFKSDEKWEINCVRIQFPNSVDVNKKLCSIIDFRALDAEDKFFLQTQQ